MRHRISDQHQEVRLAGWIIQPLTAPVVMPLDQELADQHREYQHRQHDHGAAGGDLAPLPALIVHEIDDGDRRRHRLVARQDQREEEVVPAVEEAQDGGGGDAGPGDRQHDAGEALP